MDYFRELNFVSVALRLLLSAVIGFSLGLERGRKRRPAGCRTYMLVCMGATLTLLLSQYEYIMVTTKWASIASEIGLRTDVSRFGAQVINGVGFLGAGTILVTGRREVKGLTTAAGLWASACMGLAIGAGFYECVFLGTVLIFLSMRYLPIVENMMVEHAPFLNIYVEFESLDHIGDVIGRIKEQNAQVLDVEVDHGRGPGSSNPSAVFSLRLAKRHSHSDVLVSISAGFRTHILICLGAAITTLTSQFLYLNLHYYTDMARLGAQVVAGIGFIGAGTIVVTRQHRVKGLTTAAGLWASAIIGLALGGGFYEGALLTTVLVLVAESFLSRLEYRILDHVPEINLYMEYTGKPCLEEVLRFLRENKVSLQDMEITRNSDSESHNACAIFSLRFSKGVSVDELLTHVSQIEGVITVQEL